MQIAKQKYHTLQNAQGHSLQNVQGHSLRNVQGHSLHILNKIYAKIQTELKFMPLMMVGMEMLAVKAGKKMIVAAGAAV